MNLSRLALSAATALSLAGWIPGALAQTYPSKAIRLIVPFPPGGGVDVIGRVVAEALTQNIGQPVVVDNRAGAGGGIGGEAAAKAPPDGYTLLIGTASTHGANSAINPKLSYDPVRDFTPVILLATTPYCLVVTPSLAANTPSELIAMAKAQPGKLNFASYGRGSHNHLATELLRVTAGVDVVHVPYKGSSPALADLIAGQVQFMLDTFSTSLAQVKAGKVRMIGITGARRASFAPDVPTIAESGLPGYDAVTFFGIFGPAGMPRQVVDTLNRETGRALTRAEVRNRLTALGAEVVGGAPEQLGEAVATEVRKWAQLVKSQNMSFDQ